MFGHSTHSSCKPSLVKLIFIKDTGSYSGEGIGHEGLQVSSRAWSRVIFNMTNMFCLFCLCQFTKPPTSLHSNPNAIICLHPFVDRMRTVNSIFFVLRDLLLANTFNNCKHVRMEHFGREGGRKTKEEKKSDVCQRLQVEFTKLIALEHLLTWEF